MTPAPLEDAVRAALLLATLALASAAPAASAAPQTAAHGALLDYLARTATGASLAPHLVEAAVAAGIDPAAWPPESPALDRVAFPASAGALLPLLRPAHAWALAGRPLADVAGRDVGAEILAAFDGTQFGDPALLNDDIFAILALRADSALAGDARIAEAAHALAAQQRGGWPWQAGGDPETDVTGMALLALQGLAAPDAEAAAAFLASARDGDGYALAPGGKANCDSTVWALRAARLLGREPAPAAWGFLLALQRPDGGLAYQPGQPSNPLCSAEAAVLMAEAPPPAATPRRAAPGAAWVAVLALATAAAARLGPAHKT